MAIDFSTGEILTAIGTALTAAIAALWRSHQQNHKDTKKQLLDQQELNKYTNERIIVLSEKVGEATGYKDGVDDIAAALISEIRGEKGVER